MRQGPALLCGMFGLGMHQDAWEKICIQCGDCCFEKTIGKKGKVYHTGIPCRYLDITTRLCKVYHKRFETGEECIRLTPELVKDVNWLSPTCAYVRHVRTASAKNRDDTLP